MTITDFKTAYEKLESEMIICLLMASTYEYGYWKHYHASPFKVVSVTHNTIHLQNYNHPDTWHDLDSKQLKSGQFRIEF